MKACMLDLETLGLFPGCAVLQIGATAFVNPIKLSYNEELEEIEARDYHVLISVAENTRHGLLADAGTLFWWMKQSIGGNSPANEALARTAVEQTLDSALLGFVAWYRLHKFEEVWSNGADFDIPILAAAMRACGIGVPWSYKNTRCYRTLRALNPSVAYPPFEGRKHVALDDALNQANHARLILTGENLND